jgi:hypothetical protein
MIMQAKSSTILSMLLNRLAANSLPEDWRPADRQFAHCVRLTPDGKDLTSPEDLLAALMEDLGADVEMQIVSRVTGFGYGVHCPAASAACSCFSHSAKFVCMLSVKAIL